LGFQGSSDLEVLQLRLELLGFGEEASLQVSPSALWLEGLYAGCEVQGDLAVINAGTVSQDLEELSFETAEFTLVGAPSLPFALAVGEQLTLVVNYAPLEAGDKSSLLTLVADSTQAQVLIYATVSVYKSVLDRFTSEAHDTGECTQVFPLSAVPREDTVVVSVANEGQTSGWITQGSELIFDDPVACGALVEVAYEAEPVCD
jgi:hypothetical protein